MSALTEKLRTQVVPFLESPDARNVLALCDHTEALGRELAQLKEASA